MSSVTTSRTGARPVAQMETLKGVFSLPKMNHRRDFLRENKLSLKELQRITGKKQPAQTNEQQLRHQRQQREQQQPQHTGATGARRSASQQRASLAKQQPPPLQLGQRSISQQRILGQSQPNLDSARRPGASSFDQQSMNGSTGLTRRGSSITLGSNRSKMSCDKEIQTEDIHDEIFLYNALKKCSSESTHRNGQSDAQMPAMRGDGGPNKHEFESKTQEDEYDDQQAYYAEDYRPEQQQTAPILKRDAGCGLQDSLGHYLTNEPPMNGENNHQQMQLNKHMDQLSIGGDAQMEQPLSSRSRRTICSNKSQDSIQSKKSTTSSVHQMGNRDDLRLPRYLEREKREREEQKMREMDRDPQCPLGHYALREDERVEALLDAEKKFQTLVQELNHMPMTMETLRIRTRKREIEKELVSLEADIRIFSKQKVYMRQME